MSRTSYTDFNAGVQKAKGQNGRDAVFAVFTGPLSICRVSYVGRGSVVEPDHAYVARVLIAEDNEVPHPTSQNYTKVGSEFSGSQYSVQADSSGG
jgi:hypothetical protein